FWTLAGLDKMRRNVTPCPSLGLGWNSWIFVSD
ncbi:hypothetical protein A2U01_0063325, partial [Trifolium medium]|nr:hypothetical protein [Trifolium medium]